MAYTYCAEAITILLHWRRLLGKERAPDQIGGALCCVPSMFDSQEVKVLYPS